MSLAAEIVVTCVGAFAAVSLTAIYAGWRDQRKQVAGLREHVDIKLADQDKGQDKRVDELRRHFDARFTVQDDAMRANTQGLAVIVSQFQPLERRVAEFERRGATLSEATAVLTQTLEVHQRWIEERDREARTDSRARRR